jgi:hypothetical protein
MANKTNIQTDLVGVPVLITNAFPDTTLDGKRGWIRSAYLTSEGPKLTVELQGNGCADDGRLVDVWNHAVQVRG